MTFRALLIGLLLAVVLSAVAYFNDHVIKQTFLIGNHLPASVFGVGVLLVLCVNPLLRCLGPGWTFRPAELALILAMGLAVCGWPSSNMLRVYAPVVSIPAHAQGTHPNWAATNIMAYVPGTAPIVAEGYVLDWPTLIRRLQRGAEPDAPPALSRLDERLNPLARQALANTINPDWIEPDDRQRILGGSNEVLADPSYYDPKVFATVDLDAQAAALAEASRQRALTVRETVTLNRAVLETAMPGVFAPPPSGEGVLLIGGQSDPAVTEPLFLGNTGDGLVWPQDTPWAAWWPTHRLWIGTSLLLGLATLFMMLIVHPQWSQREHLIYPTVQFVRDMTATQPRAFLPEITKSRLFWVGLAVPVVVHAVNGLHGWFENVPEIPRDLDFGPMRQLLPAVTQVPANGNAFTPVIYFAVIGFGFLINARVAMSVGLSLYAWLALGAVMVSFGEPLGNNRFNMDDEGQALRFGAYVGMTLMILYLGRRHYLNVAAASVGLKRLDETPGYTVWAARGMVFACAAATYLLIRYGGLDLMMSTLMIASVLMFGLVLARVNVETGLFYAQPDVVPAVIFAGLFGVQGVGPEALIVLGIASTVYVADPREAVAPYLANGLAMTDRVGHTPPRRAAWPILVMLVLGLLVATVASQTIQYNRGLRVDDGFAQWLPRAIFDKASSAVDDLVARDELVEATGISGLDRIRNARPNATTVTWTIVGLALVTGCAFLRLRFAGWPVHPILFIIWGSYPANNFAFSFLLAGILKLVVMMIGGNRGVRTVKPMMIGLIAGDLVMVILWSVVGSIYFAVHKGQVIPPSIRIFTG